MVDPHELDRFLSAQAPVYATALAELRAGQKRSHWMWFVFPQLRGLGYSENAVYYGIASRAQAEAYLAHPVLGARLKECTEVLLAVEGKSALEILGDPDDAKLRSCLTLFAAVAPGECFDAALQRFFDGEHDPRTLSLLAP